MTNNIPPETPTVRRTYKIPPMPDIVGMPVEEAREALKAAGLHLRSREEGEDFLWTTDCQTHRINALTKDSVVVKVWRG